MTSFKAIVGSSLFLVLFSNFTFFKNVTDVYAVSWQNSGFLISLALFLMMAIMLLIRLVSSRYTLKPIIIVFLLISATTSYFMNTYHVIIDDTMIQNMAETNVGESLDLLTFKLVIYVLFLGVLPSFVIYKIKITFGTFKKELWITLKTLLFCIVVIAGILFSFSKFYTSFFRENKSLRYHTNPTYALYSTGKYIHDRLSSSNGML